MIIHQNANLIVFEQIICIKMAIGELFFLGGPASLLELSVQTFIKIIPNLIPPNTKRVEWCSGCELRDYKSFGREITLNCKCFRYYKNISDLLSILPFELQEKILEVAQKELDNSTSAQILLGRKMKQLMLIISQA